MTTLVAKQSGARRHRYIPLLQRVVAVNALLVLVAVAATIAVLAPGRVTSLALNEELAAVVAAVTLVVAVNVVLLRRIVAPLQALTAFARRVDLTSLRQRMPDAGATSEAGELALTFNEMLTRLEAERRESTGRVLRAQEDERMRIAQELHDQVGQDLTAVLLALSRIAPQTPPHLRGEVVAVNDAVRSSLDNVRRIAIELRPEALDDLGLPSALAVLVERFSHQLDMEVSDRIAADLPRLTPEIELVVYRVAQEALTNVARHSASNVAELSLTGDRDRLVLCVRDFGIGLPRNAVAGTGIRGMRERAALIGATVTVANHRIGSGCEVRLEVPVEGCP